KAADPCGLVRGPRRTRAALRRVLGLGSGIAAHWPKAACRRRSARAPRSPGDWWPLAAATGPAPWSARRRWRSNTACCTRSLSPRVQRRAHQQLDLGHLKRRRVRVPHQIADEAAIVGDLARTFAIAHAGRLHDGLVIPHTIDGADEPVVEHGELLPAKRIDFR